MKKIILLLISIFLVSCGSVKEIDNTLAKNAEVVLRIKCEKETGACDKYCWQKVKILKIIKNEKNYKFNDALEVAYYSWDKGIPIGISTIYLEKYNPERNDLWKLVGGKSETGVSHYKK